jgi:hypothetical protein
MGEKKKKKKKAKMEKKEKKGREGREEEEEGIFFSLFLSFFIYTYTYSYFKRDRLKSESTGKRQKKNGIHRFTKKGYYRFSLPRRPMRLRLGLRL